MQRLYGKISWFENGISPSDKASGYDGRTVETRSKRRRERMAMTSKQRMVAALERREPDRLPVTTHHVMPFFLNKYMDGIDAQAFFDHFGLDPILWTGPILPYETENWRIEWEDVPGGRSTRRVRIVTPKGSLTTTMESNEHTTWCTEHFIKTKHDIELIAAFCPAPRTDVEALNREADAFGERGLVRGTICCFDIFGQPGCWQDAACLFGIQNLIEAALEDPEWVHEFLGVLLRRKLAHVGSMKGARFDLLELGGGDGSSTVISPALFEQFIIPYESQTIALAHEMGQRVVYHTCGGMMPILEEIVSMKPDAIETLTPAGMGGDMNLREAKRRVGDKVCMIGGFDQFHFYLGCTPEATRAEVRRCFEEAGEGGGFILSPSDHFFDAELQLIEAYADEARSCRYADAW